MARASSWSPPSRDRSIPRLRQPFASNFRTLVNFEATFGGHSKFWWANTDGSANRETYDEPSEARLYPGSWAPAAFQGIEGGILVRHWLTCGPFGGPGAEKFRADPNGLMPGTNKDMKVAVREFCEAAAYPPDSGPVDPAAVFKGDMVQGYWPARSGKSAGNRPPSPTSTPASSSASAHKSGTARRGFTCRPAPIWNAVSKGLA